MQRAVAFVFGLDPICWRYVDDRNQVRPLPRSATPNNSRNGWPDGHRYRDWRNSAGPLAR